MEKIEKIEWNPNRSFDERCEIARKTAISLDMTYDERFAMLKARFGLLSDDLPF